MPSVHSTFYIIIILAYKILVCLDVYSSVDKLTKIVILSLHLLVPRQKNVKKQLNNSKRYAVKNVKMMHVNFKMPIRAQQLNYKKEYYNQKLHT